MATLNWNEFFEELVVFFRNQNIFTLSERGVATDTSEFNGTGAQVDFQIELTNIRNIRSITVDSVAVNFGTDYLVNYNDGSDFTTVTFTVAPGSGTDNVDIEYDFGSDKIFPEYNFEDITLSDIPRISIDEISETSKDGQIGGGSNIVGSIISLTVFEKNKFNLRARIKSIKDAVLSNQKNFYYVNYMTYNSKGPLILPPAEKTKNKVVQRSVDFSIPFIFEDA